MASIACLSRLILFKVCSEDLFFGPDISWLNVKSSHLFGKNFETECYITHLEGQY